MSLLNSSFPHVLGDIYPGGPSFLVNFVQSSKMGIRLEALVIRLAYGKNLNGVNPDSDVWFEAIARFVGSSGIFCIRKKIIKLKFIGQRSAG